MNEFNVLLAAATNGTPSGSLFDALFARYIAPQESWRELESPLPITILAAGEDLIDYRIYGNTEQTGTPTPDNPIVPSGCGERTENIFDGVITQGAYNTDTGSTISSPRYVKSSKIHLDSGGYITLTFDCPKQGSTTSGTGIDGFVYLWDGDSYIGYYQAQAKGTQTIQIPEGATDFAFAIGAGSNGVLAISDISNIMLNYGSTAPTSYIPFGYKLPMVVTNGTATTTTPIYIGSDPLAEDEYVDFGEQKVYRMEGGTLTPTDPPVPLPALPTIEGETIIDYNPSETPAVEPEKMYIKYKPQ